jgi:hypothetical protein
VCCPAGEECGNGICIGPGVCPADRCDDGSLLSLCFCYTTTEEATACLLNTDFCVNPDACNVSADCPEARVCADVANICEGISDVERACLQPCPNPAA